MSETDRAERVEIAERRAYRFSLTWDRAGVTLHTERPEATLTLDEARILLGDLAKILTPEAPLSVAPDDAWLREYERRKLALLEAAHSVSQPSGYSEDEADAFHAAERALDRWVSGSPAARQPEAERERSEMFRTHALDAVERLMEQGWAGPNPDSSDNLSEGADVVQDAIAAARQPGADAELVERLRAASNGDLNDFRPGGAERTVDEMMTLCAQAADAIARLSVEVERLREALERIVRWSEAYPVDIFPEPDLKTARVLLEAGGITLDAVSASAMRHVVNGVGQIARAALEASGADHHDAGTGET